MNDSFQYNPRTHTLHIKNYCMYTKGICDGYIPFRSEDEALAYGGRAVGLCKLCQKEREKRMDGVR